MHIKMPKRQNDLHLFAHAFVSLEDLLQQIEEYDYAEINIAIMIIENRLKRLKNVLDERKNEK